MFSRFLARLACAALLVTPAFVGAEEVNLWPFQVRRDDPAAGTTSVEALGPLIFARSGPETDQKGVRPLYLATQADGVRTGSFLYPFFTWRRESDYRTFSFFQLVNFRDSDPATGPFDKHFDVWPFYFSRTTPDPEENYRALFPIAGTLKNRFGKDQIKFALFPLYAEVQKNEGRTTHAPWPFLRFINGEGYHGFEFWPLFGRNIHDGDYDRQFWIWPLGYRSVTHLSEPEPDVALGILPFYSRDTGPGYVRENYVWPFFGYTHRTAPHRYDEQRYFWPFLVQGRGDDRFTNRWAPVYTHSVIKGYDKTWVLWPLYRHARWDADGVAQQKDTVLFFLWWSLQQRSLANPEAAPAHKVHLWPLFSSWDNGAGRRQFQALSPFEVFFPQNDTIRQLWSPLFALYRYEGNGDTERRALLWNAVTWRRDPESREFHFGPLLGVRTDASGRRVAFGHGLFGWRHAAGDRPRFFLFDFHPPAAMKASQASSP
ncbi:MAG TPA: hypothetical protein VG734_13555 [Lacunisphaera sp.]|nr:hypothetical protein [Lacunisphaera sp.]